MICFQSNYIFILVLLFWWLDNIYFLGAIQVLDYSIYSINAHQWRWFLDLKGKSINTGRSDISSPNGLYVGILGCLQFCTCTNYKTVQLFPATNNWDDHSRALENPYIKPYLFFPRKNYTHITIKLCKAAHTTSMFVNITP